MVNNQQRNGIVLFLKHCAKERWNIDKCFISIVREIRKVHAGTWATVGEVSNSEHKLRNIGKAGRSRHMGIRPTVRGSAMNAVDHPHGGGEGRQGISLRRGPKTRHGKLAYGVKTRRSKKYSNDMIVSRRKTKRNKS